MATEAGRRVVLGVFWLTSVAFALGVLLLGTLTLLGLRAGWLSSGAAAHVGLGMVGGLFAVLIAFVLLPVMGRLSRLGDAVRLLELCDPGAPLLRTLMQTAPGTYNHSIMVGSMAEAAADAIGADALLARVGAYYHDIGKIARPQFFTENQMGLRNPHDAAPPEQSAFIITAHVRDGVAMAQHARLPLPVIDIIEQHHGTSLVAYFYGKASSGGLDVDETPFRYEGALPASREAALVMLADVAEAAGRALADCGPAKIEETVRRVVECKRADGQLVDSGMSEADVEEAVVVYAKMLTVLRHARVEYPDALERS
jgi:putative nucleotidyltransferase with HDIG domain